MKHAWSTRSSQRERMDDPTCSEPMLIRTLARFEVTNRLFCRYRRVLTDGVLAVMRQDPGRSYRLTDLGAGACDIDRWLIRRCRRAGLNLEIRAVENDPRILRYAAAANRHYPEIELVEGSALDPDILGTPDFVFANHLLHHLPDEACLGLLRLIADAGVQHYMLSDLIRSPVAALAYYVLMAPLSRGCFLMEDGLRSIKRGFTRHELRCLVTQSGITPLPQVQTLFPYRFVITGGAKQMRADRCSVEPLDYDGEPVVTCGTSGCGLNCHTLENAL